MKRTLLDVFDVEFTTELRQVRRNEEAYDKATARFEEQHGFTPFDNYDSFRKKKQYKRKRRE